MPIEKINVDAVELACGMKNEGCALIADDGNPYNDIVYNEDNTYSNAYGGVYIPPYTDEELMYGPTA